MGDALTWVDVLISSRIHANDIVYSATDVLENELMGELENARLVRLLCKFGFINERPEYVFCLLPLHNLTFPVDSRASHDGPRQATGTLSSFSATTSFTRSMKTGIRWSTSRMYSLV